MKTRPKVVSVVGARPQFIKLAPLVPAMKAWCNHRILHTGQHYDDEMSAVFFRQLRIPKAHANLGIGGGTHGKMTGKMLELVERYFLETKPDFVLVYGDTNSTLAGALAAAKLGLPVGHIEAGMRSFVRDMPEEINRRLTDHISDLLYCPTDASIRNLRKEGIKEGVFESGDLMFELLHDQRKRIAADRKLIKSLELIDNEYLLMTAHRAATVDTRKQLQKLLGVIESTDMPVLFPVHPRTIARMKQFKLLKKFRSLANVVEQKPLGYFDLLSAAYHAKAVLTDSGGLQKEALFLGTPVLTLRDETEWVETVGRGNTLVGLDLKRVSRTLSRLPRVPKTSFLVRRRRPSHIIASSIKAHLARR